MSPEVAMTIIFAIMVVIVLQLCDSLYRLACKYDALVEETERLEAKLAKKNWTI